MTHHLEPANIISTGQEQATPDQRKPADKRQIALVLSGGGAKGAYQVGVIKFLESVGIKIDIVVGCSAGSLNALVLAMGGNAMALENIWLGLNRGDVFRPRWWWTLSTYFISVFLALRLIDLFMLNNWIENHIKQLCLSPDRTIPFVSSGPANNVSFDDRFLAMFGLTWLFLIGSMGGLIVTFHLLNKYKPTWTKWFDERFAFLTSIYDNTPLVNTMQHELPSIMKGIGGATSLKRIKAALKNLRPFSLFILRTTLVVSVVLAVMVIVGVVDFHGAKEATPNSHDHLSYAAKASLAILWLSAFPLIAGWVAFRRRSALEKLSKDCSAQIMECLETEPCKTPELLISTCNLDLRTDWSFFLLKSQNEAVFTDVQTKRMEGLGINTNKLFRRNGGYNFLNLKQSPNNLLGAVIASAAIPVIFPPSKIVFPQDTFWANEVHRFVDGGVGNNAPIVLAADCGASDIIVVDVNPRKQHMSSYPVSTVIDVFGRTLGAMLSAAVDEGFFRITDIKKATHATSSFENAIPRLHIIRPDDELPVTLLDFGQSVKDLIARGRADAGQVKSLEALQTKHCPASSLS